MSELEDLRKENKVALKTIKELQDINNDLEHQIKYLDVQATSYEEGLEDVNNLFEKERDRNNVADQLFKGIIGLMKEFKGTE